MERQRQLAEHKVQTPERTITEEAYVTDTKIMDDEMLTSCLQSDGEVQSGKKKKIEKGIKSTVPSAEPTSSLKNESQQHPQIPLMMDENNGNESIGAPVAIGGATEETKATKEEASDGDDWLQLGNHGIGNSARYDLVIFWTNLYLHHFQRIKYEEAIKGANLS